MNRLGRLALPVVLLLTLAACVPIPPLTEVEIQATAERAAVLTLTPHPVKTLAPLSSEPAATIAPTLAPTVAPTATTAPTIAPTVAPTATIEPTIAPTATTAPTVAPTATTAPTLAPTATTAPTIAPTATTAERAAAAAATATVRPTMTTAPATRTPIPTRTSVPTRTPIPSPTVDRHLMVITEADIMNAIAGGTAEQQGVTAQGLVVKFADGKLHITADSLGYGIFKLRNFDLLGRLVAKNGVLALEVESVKPGGVAANLIPGIANQAIAQVAAKDYVEEVKTLDGRVELRIR